MKQFSIYHIPFMSFFSKDLYRDVASNWKGTCFIYLLLLLLICWIFPISKMNSRLGTFIDTEGSEIISQVPTVTIADGIASIEESQPYFIKYPETGEILIVIDTTGEITSLEETEAAVLLTKTELIVKEEGGGTRNVDLAQLGNISVDQELIWKVLRGIKKALFPVLYPVALIGSFIFRIIQALIYACIGMLFVSLFHSKKSYVSLLRLAVVAVTPAIIIKTLIDLFGVALPLPGLWYFLITMGYLFFGAKAASQEYGAATESA